MCQSHKIVKHTQTIRRQQPTNCLSVFDYSVKLVLKGLTQKKRPTEQEHLASLCLYHALSRLREY